MALERATQWWFVLSGLSPPGNISDSHTREPSDHQLCLDSLPSSYSLELQIKESVMETPAAKRQRMENGVENGFGLDVGINYSESSVSPIKMRC